MTMLARALFAMSVVCVGCGERAESAKVVTADPTPAPGSSAASGSGTAPTKPPEPGTVDTMKSGSNNKDIIHGEKWQDPSEVGGGKAFRAFKEMYVYVDGQPRGVLLLPELPRTMQPVWHDDLVSLDFKPGHVGPKEKKVQILRWRLADYLREIGVDLAKIKVVYLHGAGYIEIPGDRFRKYQNGIIFDFTGNDLSKVRFYWPHDMPVNGAYDRWAAVSVFVEKPPLTTTPIAAPNSPR